MALHRCINPAASAVQQTMPVIVNHPCVSMVMRIAMNAVETARLDPDSRAGRLAITGVAKHVYATRDRALRITRDYIFLAIMQ